MTRRISNGLILFFFLAFFPVAVAAGLSLFTILEHAATAGVLLIVGYVLFTFGYWGAGDGKLTAVIGLWLGFAPSLLFVIFSALAGGLLASLIGFWFMLHIEAGLRNRRAEGILGSLRPDVPYAYALAVGALLAAPYAWFASSVLAV